MNEHRVRVAAARARVTADKKRGVETPQWILDLADGDRSVGEFIEDAIRKELLRAADVMPIETLGGADGASVWLRKYAENWGKGPK